MSENLDLFFCLVPKQAFLWALMKDPQSIVDLEFWSNPHPRARYGVYFFLSILADGSCSILLHYGSFYIYEANSSGRRIHETEDLGSNAWCSASFVTADKSPDFSAHGFPVWLTRRGSLGRQGFTCQTDNKLSDKCQHWLSLYHRCLLYKAARAL